MIIYNAQPVRFTRHFTCYHRDIPRRNEDILMKMKYIDPKANTYSLPEFCQKYDTESACEQALYNLKWPEGYTCPKCGFDCHTIICGRRLPLYQCPLCRCRTTVIVGTIMECAKLPLTKWFLALYFAGTNKDDISEMALAKYIGVTLKTAWSVLHKICAAMGSKDSLNKLGGFVEMDEAFFGGKASGRRGRGKRKQDPVGGRTPIVSRREPRNTSKCR